MDGFLGNVFTAMRRINCLLVVLFMILLLLVPPAFATYEVRQQWVRIGVTTGEAITAGELVAIKDSDGYAYAADANDATLRPAVGIAGKDADSGDKVEIIVIGVLTGWSSLSEGTAAYLSETAGEVTQSAPTYAQQVGVAISTTEYFVNCQNYLDTSALTALGVLSGATPIILEGASADAYETTLTVTDPTGDRTVTFPDADVNLGAIANALLAAPKAYFTISLSVNGQENTTVDPAAVFQMPFAATLVEVSAAARDIDTADGTETYTVDLEEAGVSVLSSAVAITADATPVVATISDSAIADNAKMEVVLTIGGDTPTIDDLTVLLTFKVAHTN